jgi:hypothetical protein
VRDDTSSNLLGLFKELMVVLCYMIEQCPAKKNNTLPYPFTEAANAIAEFNKDIIKIYMSYLLSYANAFQWELGEDNVLPLSKLRVSPIKSLSTDSVKVHTLNSFM